MDNKVGQIAKLMKEIKAKIETISSYNVSIKEFNFKLEALLIAFEAYTVYDTPPVGDTCENVLNKADCSSEIPREEIFTKGKRRNIDGQDTKDRIQLSTPSPDMMASSKEESLAEFTRRMEVFLPNNKLVRNNSAKIARCLYFSREGMLLEEIMRDTGISKYRCIDVLNRMLKVDPPLLVKRFDRGFIYSIVLL